MGSVYRRRRRLWLAFVGPDGHRVLRSSGFLVGEEKKARALLARLEAAVASDRPDELLHLTFAGYVKRWGTARVAQGLTNAKNDQARLERYAVPTLGRLLLTQVRPRHVHELITSLKNPEKGLAPRTIISVAGLVRRLFNDAVSHELVESSPYQLKRGELPKKRDKNPGWRSTALFTRDEAERLISDPALPEGRRVVYALGLLAGLREGEVSALRWRAIDKRREPLGSVAVVASFTRKNKREKAPKTGLAREVPLHPALATLLARWRLSGWAKSHGRQPKADDLVVPNQEGRHITDNNLLRALAIDLVALGMRPRRFHDARRTFISLARGDGANRDVLRTCTHDPMGDQFDQYTTFTHADRCEAVGKLKLELREGRLLKMAAGQAPETSGTDPLHSLLHARGNVHNDSTKRLAQGGIRSLLEVDPGGPSDQKTRASAGAVDSEGPSSPQACSSVAVAGYVTFDEQAEAGHA